MKLWVARDDKGYIGLYKQRPVWREIAWCTDPVYFDWVNANFLGYLEKGSFPEVTFENSPQEVELTLLNKNSNE